MSRHQEERHQNWPFPLPRQARVAVLASGRGSNLQALLDAFPPSDPLATVRLVVSDEGSAQALSRAQERGVEAVHVPWQGRRAFEERLDELLQEREIDLVCLAGFMRILSPGFVERHRYRVLNIHPSLLPEFPGLDPQLQALRAGVSESGCTVHFVDAGIDTGRPLHQRRVPVEPGDDEESLSRRILEQEHRAYPEAVLMLLSGEARPPEESPPAAGKAPAPQQETKRGARGEEAVTRSRGDEAATGARGEGAATRTGGDEAAVGARGEEATTYTRGDKAISARRDEGT